ncbi:MAG: thioredoxin domain-containing protein [Nanoarchaeota archaeon]|nr:thioredoxin domain-containing protein [Nanoarchaeota archaeon]
MDEPKKDSEHHEVKSPEHHTEHHVEHSPSKRKNDWKTFSGMLAVIIIVLLGYIIYSKSYVTGGGTVSVPAETASTKLVDFLNTRTGGGVTYVSSENKGNLYAVTVSYQGQEIPVYVTKDGNYFVQGAVEITSSNETIEPECKADDECGPNQVCTQGYCTDKPKELPKSDKPKAELFIMTHCPYGTQAEKGLIPAIKALGTKADAKVRFVHYFMHGDKEEKETYNQVCIREEQSAKYIPYLECFLEAGDSAGCIKKTGVDATKLNTCLANDNKKAKEYYEVDKKLSNQYGVQGSPTLIINGVEASSGRDSASMLKTICSAFNKAPASECSKNVSSASPSPGFGYAVATGAAAANSDAGCVSA